MNMRDTGTAVIADSQPAAFGIAEVREARALAAGSQRRVVEVLEERSELEVEAFTRVLAQTLGYRALAMADLHALEAAFDLLPFPLALERGCVLFREPAICTPGPRRGLPRPSSPASSITPTSPPI
jgi:general secretion pathway protein E